MERFQIEWSEEARVEWGEGGKREQARLLLENDEFSGDVWLPWSELSPFLAFYFK